MKRELVILAALVLLFSIPVYARTGEKLVYGHSGEGRELVAYRYGEGEHVLVMCFAIHGYEDNWDQDGRALVYSAGKLQDYLEKSSLPDLHNWTVYVLPCLNPDGLYSGWTNNGPGRCTTTYIDSSGKVISGKGIDMNRCFPTWFRPMTDSRNFNGDSPMACWEARSLSAFLHDALGGKTNVLMDVHGWYEQTITTSSRIHTAVRANFPTNSISNHNGGSGYLISYAHTMGYESCLLELPAHFTNYNQYVASDCTQRIIDTVAAILKSEKTVCSARGHQYDILEKAATCTQAGYEKKRCRICGHEENTTFPALGHNPMAESLVILREPTACRAGIRSFACSRCGAEDLKERIPAVFRDVKEDAYYSDSLDWSYRQGYIKGVTEDTFQPDTPLSRAMLVTILHRYAGQPESTQTAPFADIPSSAYYIPALNWAYGKEIIQGVSATEFAPQDHVTRQQAIAIFHRFVRMQNGDNGLREHAPFPDEGTISGYALDAAHWSAANGIILGDEKGNLNPKGFATRAQSVTILMRLDDYLTTVLQEGP